MRAGFAATAGALVALALSAQGEATARAQTQGFALHRHEPVTAGDSTFAVEHPWYSSTRLLAFALSLDYARDPLVLRLRDAAGNDIGRTALVSDALLGHLDLAGSYWDRLALHLSLPVVLAEVGHASNVLGLGAVGGAAMGDPRIDLRARIIGQPERERASLSAGVDLWIPVGTRGQYAGDANARFRARLIGAGVVSSLRWSATAGLLVRGDAVIGSGSASGAGTTGHELEFGAALAYADPVRKFTVGPEATFATLTAHPFSRDASSLELLVGGSYLFWDQLSVGAALGMGVLGEPGTPAFRGLLRVAWAPVGDKVWPRAGKANPPAPAVEPRPPSAAPAAPSPAPEPAPAVIAPPPPATPVVAKPSPPVAPPPSVIAATTTAAAPTARSDGDHDGIPDAEDACAATPGAPDANPAKNGCPGLVVMTGSAIVTTVPIFFAPRRDLILPRSHAVVDAVARALVATPSIHLVAIEGHTDNMGRRAANMDLSDRRARSVLRYLVRAGVAEDRLTSQGFGPTRPVATNTTEAGRAQNRRVEFRVIDASH